MEHLKEVEIGISESSKVKLDEERRRKRLFFSALILAADSSELIKRMKAGLQKGLTQFLLVKICLASRIISLQ